MQRPSRFQTRLLLLGSVLAGVLLLALSTRALAAPPRWHGAFVGALIAVYGLFLFGLGNIRGRKGRGGPPRTLPGTTEGTVASPENAKFWLRKFLEEQQKRKEAP